MIGLIEIMFILVDSRETARSRAWRIPRDINDIWDVLTYDLNTLIFYASFVL
jgi:hypothetical protein